VRSDGKRDYAARAGSGRAVASRGNGQGRAHASGRGAPAAV